MKNHNFSTSSAIALALLVTLSLALQACGEAKKEPAKPPVKPNSVESQPEDGKQDPPTGNPDGTTGQPAVGNGDPVTPEVPAAAKKVVLTLKFPKAAFEGTPKNIDEPGMEKTPPSPLMVPEGLTNVALNKLITGSDEEPIIGTLDLITDGDKAAGAGSFVELGFGKQYVQIDLEGMHEIHAIALWHYHGEPRVYRDVVVQVSTDPDFIESKTLFNSDRDGSAGLGLGQDFLYIETNKGREIDGKGVKAAYVRLYSNGNTSNDENHYTEVEVYGKAAP